MASKILVVAAHPDDEVLGLGGTLARHAAEGDEVHVLVLCEGMSLRYPNATEDFLADEGRQAARELNLATWGIHGFPDQRLDSFPLTEIAAPIERKVAELQPRIVYTHWSGDINRDHKIACEATLVAARCKETCVEEIRAYETPSETEWGIPYNFSPNYFVDISNYLQNKLAAMRAYKSQCPAPPHPRSVEHLETRARYWGNLMMMDMAEPFAILRRYWR